MPNVARPSQHDEAVRPSCSAGEFDLDRVRKAVSGIRYGEVRLIIQDGIIVQIDRIEKQRLR